jgi:hypothetical protein
MKVSTRYYPYPVLSNFSDDILDSFFDADIDIKSNNNIHYTIKVKFKLNNLDLIKYIHQGKACFALHIECPNTRMRDVYKSEDNEFSFDILADKLNGKVEVNAFIIASERIDNYSNSKFHNDYTGLIFTVMKGDVLAVSEGQKFEADKDKDELKHIPSIFTVGKNSANDAPPLDIDMGQTNKIVIKLSKSNFEYYGQLSKSTEMGKIISSDFEYEQYEDCKWFKSIENRLKSLGHNIKVNPDFTDSTIVIAQKLIGDPLNGSFKDLFDYISQD